MTIPLDEAPPEAPGAPDPALLFGADLTPGVVAVETEEREAVLIRATDEGRAQERRPFRPWLMASEEAVTEDGPVLALRDASWTRLQGTGLAWLVEFGSWGAFLNGRDALRAAGIAHYCSNQPVKQFLMRSGVTLFKALQFEDVRRLQFDLETTTLRPHEPDARILLIAVGDNRGNTWALAGDDERQMLRDFVELVREVDPDTLEGHNLFGFDLPYLAARAGDLGVALPLGRNGSPLAFGRERNLPIGGITRPFKPAYVWGRHVLDTLFGVQRFDVGRLELEAHGLKEVALHYGIAAGERVYLNRAALSETWKTDPERVRRYAAHDIEETRRLAELVLPTEFYQSQMVPESYQGCATGGTGEKINSLLIREYLRRGHAIPQPQPPVASPGGYTEIRETGVLRRVVKADVESLYPTLMLRYGIRPATDTLGIFLPMLSELTARRLDAKARMRAAPTGPERAYWDGLQSSFKILINSFYGYLGAPFNFNDHQAAARVTTTGQTLVKQVADAMERSGSQVIEIDTDGVYFVPPPEVQSEDAEAAYVERIAAELPDGIRLAYDGRYAAMVSLKIKNYVLVGYDGKKIIRGSSLRSRADERFGREFLTRAIDYLVAGDLEGLAREYGELSRKITRGELPVEAFARRERITAKTFESDAKKRSRKVARDAQVGDTMVVYQRSDGSLGLASEYAGDEDRWYYLDKLYRFAQRLEGALGDEFARVFPRPGKKRLEAELAGQGTLF